MALVRNKEAIVPFEQRMKTKDEKRGRKNESVTVL